jgi:hypothetical protein
MLRVSRTFGGHGAAATIGLGGPYGPGDPVPRIQQPNIPVPYKNLTHPHKQQLDSSIFSLSLVPSIKLISWSL